MNTEKKSNYEFILVAVYWFIWGFIGLDRLLVGYLLPNIVTDLNISYTQAGLLVSLVGFTFGAMAMIGGGLSWRYGRGKLIIVGTLLCSLMSCMFGFVKSFAQLALIRLTLGVGAGLYASNGTATISEESTPKRRGLLLGIHASGFSVIGMVIGPVYALKVATSLSWQWAFYLTLIPGIILAIAHWKLIREPASTARILEARKQGTSQSVDEKENNVKWTSLLKNWNVLVSGITTICLTGWLYTFTAFSSSFLNINRGISMENAVYLLSIYGIGAAVGGILGGAVSDHLGRKNTFFLASIICGLSTVGFVYAPGNVTVLSIIAFIMGLSGLALFVLATAIIPTEAVSFELAAISVGIVLFMGEVIGSGLFPAIGGFLADSHGLNVTLMLSGLIFIAPVIFGFFLKETAPKKSIV